jgi:hypothetical protein
VFNLVMVMVLQVEVFMKWVQLEWVRDPKTSVLNGNNQVWDAPNVFVTDGAFMTSASCVNPSLTYMAFTARAC